MNIQVHAGARVEQETKADGLRCRPGDLAIVTKCGVVERIGLLVRIVEPCVDGRHDWLTELQGPGVSARDVRTGQLRVCQEALMYDWNLTPITGLGLRRQSGQNAHEPNLCGKA